MHSDKNFCILVAGAPATGKSTLAQTLSKELELPLLSKDASKEILFDVVGFRSRAEKVILGEAAFRLLLYTAEQLLAAHIPFIIENNFESSSKEQIESLLNAYNCPTATLLLKGEPFVLYQRFLQRQNSPSRHRGHVVNDRYPEPEPNRPLPPPPSLEAFTNGILKRGMTEPVGNGPILTIDTTDFSQVSLPEIFRWLRDTAGFFDFPGSFSKFG